MVRVISYGYISPKPHIEVQESNIIKNINHYFPKSEIKICHSASEPKLTTCLSFAT